MNLYQKIKEEIGSYDGIAVRDRGRSISYPELFRRTEILAKLLAGHGVKKYMRTAILADDSLEYILLSLAVLSLDAAIVPFSSRAPEHEIKSMLREMDIHILISSDPYHAQEDTLLDAPGILSDRCFLRSLKKEDAPARLPLPGGKIAAFIRFSSGTTGRNKGVVLSHESVIERTDACVELGVTRGENVFWVLDMAFHFVVTILLFLRRGACIVICPPPVEANMASVLRQAPANLLYATPYHYRLMTNSPEITPELLSGVRRAFSTAMKLERADAEAFREKFNHPLTQAYGIIEVGLPCVNVSDRADKVLSVGKLQKAYELVLKDADASGAGRILLRGPGFFDAYYSPFRLREEVCPGGCFDTGDVGRVDSDGFLFIVGRAKDLINFAGMKIFPYEVETVLLEHPWVCECRVSGRAAGSLGEVPEAEIVFKRDAILPENWKDVLREFCYRRLSPYKVPKSFLPVDSLPHTASGKILRRTSGDKNVR